MSRIIESKDVRRLIRKTIMNLADSLTIVQYYRIEILMNLLELTDSDLAITYETIESYDEDLCKEMKNEETQKESQ